MQQRLSTHKMWLYSRMLRRGTLSSCERASPEALQCHDKATQWPRNFSSLEISVSAKSKYFCAFTVSPELSALFPLAR
jgi:hypothetical protein